MATLIALNTEDKLHRYMKSQPASSKNPVLIQPRPTYVVNAANLKTITPGKEMDKLAADSYTIIPAVNSSGRLAEIKHPDNWANENKL